MHYIRNPKSINEQLGSGKWVCMPSAVHREDKIDHLMMKFEEYRHALYMVLTIHSMQICN